MGLGMKRNCTPRAAARNPTGRLPSLAEGFLFLALLLGANVVLGSIPPLTPSSERPPEIGFQGEGADRLAVEREVILLDPSGRSERPSLQDLEVLIDGTAVHKIDLRQLDKGTASGASSWHFEVYLDPVLSTRSGTPARAALC